MPLQTSNFSMFPTSNGLLGHVIYRSDQDNLDAVSADDYFGADDFIKQVLSDMQMPPILVMFMSEAGGPGSAILAPYVDGGQIKTIAAGGSDYSKLAEQNNVGTNWTDLATGLDDDDLITVTIEGASTAETGNVVNRSLVIRFGDLSTSGRWITVRTGGSRFEVRRVAAGQKVQVQRSTNVTASNRVLAYKIG